MTAAHAISVETFPHHRNPFDRLLIGRALWEEMTVVGVDRRLLMTRSARPRVRNLFLHRFEVEACAGLHGRKVDRRLFQLADFLLN
jgi:hypothetical protein